MQQTQYPHDVAEVLLRFAYMPSVTSTHDVSLCQHESNNPVLQLEVFPPLGSYSCFFYYLFIFRAPMTCVLLSLTHCASCCCPNAPDPRPRFLYPLVTRASILLGRPVAHSHIIFSQIKSSRTRVTAKMRRKITISSKSSNRS